MVLSNLQLAYAGETEYRKAQGSRATVTGQGLAAEVRGQGQGTTVTGGTPNGR